jgi:hypothetical protein
VVRSPFEAFPSSAAVPRHRGHCPLAVVSLPHAASAPSPNNQERCVGLAWRAKSTSGRCSTDESVATPPRCRDEDARCFPGLSRPRIWVPTACLSEPRRCAKAAPRREVMLPAFEESGQDHTALASQNFDGTDKDSDRQKQRPRQAATSNPTRHIPPPESDIPRTRLWNAPRLVAVQTRAVESWFRSCLGAVGGMSEDRPPRPGRSGHPTFKLADADKPEGRPTMPRLPR